MIGWGIMGAGEWADQNVAPAIRQAEGSRLVAVLSRSQERGKAFARYHEAEKSYEDFDAFLSDDAIDVVFIGTPNHLHKKHVHAAADKGKHILCGVPMAITPDDCQEILELCNQHKVIIGIDFQHRKHPQFLALKRVIDSGEIGQIVTMRAQVSIPWEGGHRGRQVWRVPYEGAFKDEHDQESMIHGRGGWKKELGKRGSGILSGPGMLGIDTIRFILGSEVESVYATGDFITAPGHQETCVMATLSFQNGAVVSFECCRSTPFARNQFEVNGTLGRATTFGFTPWDSLGKLEVRTKVGTRIQAFDRYNMFVDHIEEMNMAIKENRPPNPSGYDGLRERMITQAIRESAMKKRIVKIQ